MTYTHEQIKTGEWVRTISNRSYRGWHAFYHTTSWKRKREEILKRDHRCCQICRQKGRYIRATTVHHIRHLKDAPELALTNSNLQSLCKECHEAQHPEYRFKQKGFANEEKW